jgi:hypothetical protein
MARMVTISSYHGYECSCRYHGLHDYYLLSWVAWLQWLPVFCCYHSWNVYCLVLMASVATTYGYHGYKYSCGYHCFRGYHGWFFYCLMVPLARMVTISVYHGYECSCRYHGLHDYYLVPWVAWLQWLPVFCCYHSRNVICLVLMASIATTYGYHGYKYSCGYHS